MTPRKHQTLLLTRGHYFCSSFFSNRYFSRKVFG